MSGLRKLGTKGTERGRVEPLHPAGAPRGEKLSAVILDFARPLLDRFPDDGDFESAISLAVMCWNLALFPEAEGRDVLRPILQEIAKGPSDFAQETQAWIEILVERKKKLFAADRRIVMRQTVADEEGMHRLLVTSMPAPDWETD
jgi:hypothetical protein